MKRSHPRPKFSTRSAQLRNRLLAIFARPLQYFSARTRFMIATGVMVLITTLVITQTGPSISIKGYKERDIARSTVVSPEDIVYEDPHETERRRNLAMSIVSPVFRFDPARTENIEQYFRSIWKDLFTSSSQSPNKTNNQTSNENSSNQPTSIPSYDKRKLAQVLSHHRSSSDLDHLITILRDVTSSYIYEDKEAGHLKSEIILINSRTGIHSKLSTLQNSIVSISQAQRKLRDRISTLTNWTNEEREALASILIPLISANLAFDQQATDTLRKEAAQAIESAIVTLKRNQVIIREGEVVTPQVLSQFKAINSHIQPQRYLHHFVGFFLIISALFWAVWQFTERRRSFNSIVLHKQKAFLLVCSAVVVETVLMRVGFVVSESLAQRMTHPLDDPMLWSFAIPFASAALLVAMLVDSQLGFITGIITALIAGIITPVGLGPHSILMSLYAMTSASTAIYGINRYRERQSVTLAGLFDAGVNAIMAIAVILAAQQPLNLNTILLAIGFGILGGMLTTIFTAGGLPINEAAFEILTDVKLLELSNADLPVLGQLALRAPGTNQHSHGVGQLAEEASRAVGANPLLARIGALYHDIGKLAAPEMFIENQQNDNPHDRLRPSNSARIIISHVTYGLKLAKELGLPKQIADFIPQHHGTRALHYFLRKAQDQAAPGEVIDENEFRYPGPKPQFKEAAIMMLADACEAAARSLTYPDPENIRTIVNKIFDAILSDGQLDECDLNLRELKVIKESMISSLTAIHHLRIDYPGFNPPQTPRPVGPLPDAALDTEEHGFNKSQKSPTPLKKAVK
jgi:cyclic-di-AMP phosphodiesterase PgpH